MSNFGPIHGVKTWEGVEVALSKRPIGVELTQLSTAEANAQVVRLWRNGVSRHVRGGFKRSPASRAHRLLRKIRVVHFGGFAFKIG
jgi:hypothetical protein